MKCKIILSFVLAVVLSTADVSAKIFRFGLKGGLNLADISLSDIPSNFKTSNMTGFHIGPMLEFTLPIIGLGIEGAALYSQKGFTINEHAMKTNNIDIPVNLKWKFGLPFLKLYVAAGPYFSFGLGGTTKGGGNEVHSYSLQQKGSAVGANIGAGVELFKHLQVGLNYGFGFGSAYELKIDDILDAKAGKDRLFSVSAAILF